MGVRWVEGTNVGGRWVEGSNVGGQVVEGANVGVKWVEGTNVGVRWVEETMGIRIDRGDQRRGPYGRVPEGTSMGNRVGKRDQ